MTKSKTETNKVLVTKANFYKTAKKINGAIEVAYVNQTELMQEYQRIAVSTINHMIETGDVSVMHNLFNRFPAALRLNAMQKFFSLYAPVKVETVTEGKKTVLKWSYDKDNADLSKAQRMPWFDTLKVQALQVKSLQADIDKLIKTYGNIIEKPRTDKVTGEIVNDDVPVQLFNSLKRLATASNVG